MAANVCANLNALGVETELLTNSHQAIKTRYMDEISGHMILRVDTPVPENFPKERFKCPDTIEADAIVISDYDKGFFEKEDLALVQKNYTGPIFIDTKKPVGNDWLGDVTCVKINEKEWRDSGSPIMDNLVVTHGKDGATWQHWPRFKPAQQVEVRDVCGAGDTFLAALVACYLKKADIKEAIGFAVQCAASVVSKQGVVPVSEHMRRVL
jgi:D-beta-D-heptose 7-phosphate kinase/D-beta-D-heptose 1-phosphate adenosyltransferase